MVFNQTGERNAAFGYLSGKSGSKNAGFGAYSLNAVTGDSNTAVGYYAGGGGNGNATGANNVIVGYQAGVDDAAAANKIVIGQGATGTTDNTVLLGNGSITNWLPTDTNEVDLGSSTKEMKDIYVDGVAYTDAIGFGTVAMTLPTADGSANQVLKTDGSGALGWATVSGGGGSLAQLTENSKTGYRLSEADANNYGEIGASAVDLSISSTASSTKGATGTNSFATNISTASGTQSFAAGSSFASGTQSTAFGYNNNSPGQFSFATGQGSYSYGARSTTLGMANEARGTLSVTTGKYTVARDYGTLVIGQYNSVGNLAVTSNGSGTVFDTDNSAFVIGNGESGSLSDAFVVYSNGNTTTSGDLSLGGSNKELRFYEGANYVGFEAPALSADKIWVLPAADGSVGQILKTDGSGTLSWTTNVSGASSLDALSDAFFNSSAANLVVGHIPGNITSGTSNSAFSNHGLEDLTSGLYNNVFGSEALSNLTTGNGNTAMGHKTMQFLVDGSENTGFGQGALYSLTSGGNNTAVGVHAGRGNQTGRYNTSVGQESLDGSGNNASNTAVGFRAGKGITTGSDNVFIGKNAGYTIDDGSSNVVIGDDADVSATNSSNQIVIGKGATGQRTIRFF